MVLSVGVNLIELEDGVVHDSVITSTTSNALGADGLQFLDLRNVSVSSCRYGVHLSETARVVMKQAVFEQLGAGSPALTLESAEAVVMSDSRLADNGMSGQDVTVGGVYVLESMLNMTDCVLRRNRGREAGAMLVTHDSDVTLTRCIVEDNAGLGSSKGGAIRTSQHAVTQQ